MGVSKHLEYQSIYIYLACVFYSLHTEAPISQQQAGQSSRDSGIGAEVEVGAKVKVVAEVKVATGTRHR